jgi:hypothetical protein
MHFRNQKNLYFQFFLPDFAKSVSPEITVLEENKNEGYFFVTEKISLSRRFFLTGPGKSSFFLLPGNFYHKIFVLPMVRFFPEKSEFYFT